jgi:hypothetical protein
MTPKHSSKGVRERARPLPSPAGGTDEMRKLAAFLIAMLQVPGTSKAWISLEEVADRVSRKRQCSARDVSDALRGDVVPALDIVEAVVGLRAGKQVGRDSSGTYRVFSNEAERLRSDALLSQLSLRDKQPPKSQPEPKRFRKRLAWASGVAFAAVISPVVTNVVPQMLNQVANGAKLKDAIRRGPDIITNESIYDPDGNGVVRPFVVPGNYRPSDQVVLALSKAESVMSTTLMKEIHKVNSVAIEDVFTRVVLQGNRNESIRILNIYPVNLRRTRPLDGVLFDIPEAQGEFGNIQMNFNLDQISPHALTVINDDVITNQPFFEAHTISLADGERAVLIIQAHTRCYSASFDLAVNYMVGSADRTEVISDNGHPFRVSSYRFTETGRLSYRQDFQLQGNFSVAPLRPQSKLINDYFKGCPYFAASGGN